MKLTDRQISALKTLVEKREATTAQVTLAVFEGEPFQQQRARPILEGLVRRGLAQKWIEELQGFQKRSWYSPTATGRAAIASVSKSGPRCRHPECPGPYVCRTPDECTAFQSSDRPDDDAPVPTGTNGQPIDT